MNYPNIRTGSANTLPAYLAENHIQPHQAWVAYVAQHGSPSLWCSWLDFVASRYGY